VGGGCMLRTEGGEVMSLTTGRRKSIDEHIIKIGRRGRADHPPIKTRKRGNTDPCSRKTM